VGWYLKDWVGLIHLIANPISFTAGEKQLTHGSRVAYWALAVVFLAVYVGSMFTPGLLDDADSTHAEAAREMFVSGDYVTLHVNGVRYLEKAPLPYWLVAFSYKLLGVNELSTRLPMVLSVMLLGVLAFCWGRRAFGERTGIYAGLFAYTCAGVYLFTRVLIPEVLLSLLIAAALYLFLTALEPEAAAWRWYAGYAMMALGVLTKGLIALVFPCGAGFFFLLVTGEWRRWREFRLISGLALFLVIAAPWHILAGLRNPGTAEHHGFFWFVAVPVESVSAGSGEDCDEGVARATGRFASKRREGRFAAK
jgi:4-amino-4-deoxy-L-arabinose transferase-like glycosyltransferase